MKTFVLAWAAMTLSALLSTNAHAQYRWTDANGKANYGDAPPAGAKDVQRVGGDAPATAGASAADPSLPYELRVATERFPVTLYTTANCAPCDQARSFLQRRGVPFSEKTVRFKEEADLMQRTGLDGTEFPTATIGRQTKRGFKEGEWTIELNAAGYPAKSQIPPHWKPAPAQPLMDLPKGTPAHTNMNNPGSEEPTPTPAPTPAIKLPFGGTKSPGG